MSPLTRGVGVHHQARTAARDVRDHRSAAMQLGDGAEIDREGELDLLTLAKTEVRGLHEHTGGGEIDRPTEFLSTGWRRDVHRGPRTMPGMQSAHHRLNPRCCRFAHQALLAGLLPCETGLLNVTELNGVREKFHVWGLRRRGGGVCHPEPDEYRAMI